IRALLILRPCTRAGTVWWKAVEIECQPTIRNRRTRQCKNLPEPEIVQHAKHKLPTTMKTSPSTNPIRAEQARNAANEIRSYGLQHTCAIKAGRWQADHDPHSYWSQDRNTARGDDPIRSGRRQALHRHGKRESPVGA